MIKNNFYPLRTIVGSSISIKGIFPFQRVAPPMKIVTRNHPDIYHAVNDEVYSNYLPDIIKDGVAYHPIQGMDTMPVSNSNLFPFDNIGAQGLLNIFKNPSDNPFPETDSFASIFGFQEDNFIELQLNSQQQDDQELTNHLYSGRDRAYSFLIHLDKEELVGGICFNGYPFISSRIENKVEGMTIGNFGLPRELRLTPLPSFVGKSIEELTGFQRSQFIDSEFAYTRQEILSHSGLNYLTIDPVKTNLFLLTITDLPFIPKTIDLDTNKDDLQNPLLIHGFKGFAIPYLFFFEYKEQTKRNARLHSGLLGVKTDKAKNQDGTLKFPTPLQEDGGQDILRRAFPEWEYYFLEEEKAKEKPDNKKTKQLLGEIAKLEAELKKNPKQAKEIKDKIKKLKDELKKQKPKTTEDNSTTKKEGVYWVYTAHSALGQRREFGFSYANLNYSDKVRELPAMRKKKTLTECFISDLLQPKEKVTLYLQQGEEFDRCVAGLKALFLLIPDDDATEKFAELLANSRGIGDGINQLSLEERTFVEDALAFYLTLPPETNFCEEFSLKIYEVDPIEGISPASVDLNSKYATLLADITVNDFMDVIFSQLIKGIPFRKTSSAKYFALEFTNTGQKAGQVAIHSLQMIRSANVSVQPRPAKTQQVKAMHYRIIGSELADDFSKLGNEGFNFSIDRVTAGQTKNVLYSAMSLLDLLHTGGARIHSNVRRRAIEFEKTEVYTKGTPNFQINSNSSGNMGWRKSEAGSNVRWPNSNIPIAHKDYLQNSPFSSDPDLPDFESMRSSETRTHNELLGPDMDENLPANPKQEKIFRSYRSILSFVNFLGRTFYGDDFTMVSIPNGIQLESGQAVWRDLWQTLGNNISRIKGTYNMSASPVGIHNIMGDSIGEFFSVLEGIVNVIIAAAGVDVDPEDESDDESTTFLVEAIKDALESIPIFGNAINAGENVLALVEDIKNLADSIDTDDMPFIVNNITAKFQKLISMGIVNGLSASVNLQPAGLGATLSASPTSIMPQISQAFQMGSQGSISKQVTISGKEYSQIKNNSYDYNKSKFIIEAGEQKRLVYRDYVPSNVNGHEILNNKRIKGAEIMWQDKIQDIITGSIPLNFTLPATATKMNFRTADDSLRVRFNTGFSPSIQVDFWFELTEETIKDDN